MNVQDQPIGVFDSGLGGLSILIEARRLLPTEDYVYFADSAYCPYGTKSDAEIGSRARSAAALLAGHDIKLLIVACNTASSVAIDELRGDAPYPIIGLEPAVKPAARMTRTGRIAVLATPRTVIGPRLQALIARHGNGVEVDLIAAPDWVGHVEAGRLSGPVVERSVAALVDPALDRGADVLVLGCTHFPFLREVITGIVGDRAAVVDSGAAIARRAGDVLASMDGARSTGEPGHLTLLTTGDAGQAGLVASTLLGEPLTADHVTA